MPPATLIRSSPYSSSRQTASPLPMFDHALPPLPPTPTPSRPNPPPLTRGETRTPPVLPPITRVVSADSVLSMHSQYSDQRSHDEVKSRDDQRSLPRSSYNEQSGFIGGLALENYRRDQTALNQSVPQRGAPNPVPIPSASPPATNTLVPVGDERNFVPVRTTSSFVSPTDLQNAPATGKRPPGARMASDPSMASNPPIARDPSKAKKGLPFLKNPMSTLLLRRKAGHSRPDPPLSLATDPRIKGTVVHDFSAPRPRRPVIQHNAVGHQPTTTGDGHLRHSTPSIPAKAPPVPPKDDSARLSRATTSFDDPTSTERSRESGIQFVGAQAENEDTQRRNSSAALSRASMSRKISAASMRSSFSAIPRHMKSTSSRFSFDMIGAAEQEKILEERHRQRQQDKTPGVDRRDSRFDEFDEDAFDYDAMCYDGDLEERIPGVNADLDDYYEEDFEAANDPDNDQDNFAGFVFQRSGPTSSLTSPRSAGLLPTPRDANGHVIGYAETGEISEFDQYLGTSLGFPAEPSPTKSLNDESAAGLGIQGLKPVAESPESTVIQPLRPQRNPQTHLSKDDELYFNDGLIHDFDGEGDGSTFDESIFDLNDTDKYGRPIHGIFANALAQRNAASETKKRESDMTSRLSAHSFASHSTAHTSFSAEAHTKTSDFRDDIDASQVPQPLVPHQTLPSTSGNEVAAYQAALAAAAHKAAASGKFRRDSSPEPPTGLMITSPTTSGSSHSQSDPVNEDALADYELDDEFSAGLDDYELDDDAIIAEANASALANDSDGWYGQEFGFYSAPVSQSSYTQSSLSEKNLYQYSHGGYFGPSGVNRTTSGRVVSQEPNLTPITERSEYSNRNSLMSVGWSQVPNSSGAIQSPGLAQLAMMAEDHDMSISALLRLRSKAWGGSQASLSSRDGSPYDRNGATSPLGRELGGVGFAPGRKNSTFSIYSQDSTGAGSDAGSPTLTMAVPNVPTNSIPSLAMSPSSAASPVVAPVFSPLLGSATFPPLSEAEEPSSPEQKRKSTNESMIPTAGVPSSQRPGIGHKHKGSADSISYVKEEDSGETRWILERRRTGETGEEVFKREVVGGGRI
ncbi:hypothetical protein NUW58_g9316 [Xylaria curta]|uniref:Uncharacterized protein n=1 Tax=Xylaria curta TaxID=42375 RepID=A0ACC1MXQ2_9PEZI|nr:hypothetical protein NUW58_g9316 [Xylaria curta]